MTGRVYLDHNATAPLRPEAAAAVAQALRQTGNPSSVHHDGRMARRLIEDARDRVAALVNAPPDAVVFTSGGTEANNQALRATGAARVVVSSIEHDSVLKARADAARCPVRRDGIIDLDALDRMLETAGPGAIVSLMLANNETGVLQPVARAARIAHQRGAQVHTDAVQAVGRVAVDFATLGVDYLTLSSHKLGGPQGAGALIVRPGTPIEAFIRGGGQERGRRAGTEPVAMIAGFGAAAEAAAGDLGAWRDVAVLRDGMEARLSALDRGLEVIGEGADRLPNTSLLAFPGVDAQTEVIALDLAGFSVSAGAACSAGKVEAPNVPLAMGVPERVARGAVRVSLGRTTSAADVDAFVAAWSLIRHTRQARRVVR